MCIDLNQFTVADRISTGASLIAKEISIIATLSARVAREGLFVRIKGFTMTATTTTAQACGTCAVSVN